jgi:subtilisin family serine protease
MFTSMSRTAAGIAAAALLGAGLGVVPGTAASGITAGDGPASTPVPIASPEGAVTSYLLNARHPGRLQTELVKLAVQVAGGVVVQAWPQIGVVVAHSTNGDFRADVMQGRVVSSVGATRTVPVTEGTPAAVGAPWGSTPDGARTFGTRKVDTDTTTEVVPDPRESEQWDMQMIKADQAHLVTDGSSDVVVGVLDSGIDPDHPDLAPNIDVADSVNCSDAGRPDLSPTGWWPTTSDHGTHVAGTIAAARNGVGIVGVAPGVRLASVKVVNDSGFIYPEYAVCGFMWAGLHGMEVTNNSYYVDPFEFYCSDQPDQRAAKDAVAKAVAWSTGQGVVHAAAAGNSAYDLANKTTDPTSPDDAATPTPRDINNGCHDIPTELPGVVTTSSVQRLLTTLDFRLSGFSNRGLGVIDVAAPGSSILSTVVAENGYGTKSGTSMASPHVAGVLALMASVHPRWTPARLVEELRSQADDRACSAATGGDVCVGPVHDNSYFGEGLVDALEAVK